MKKRYADGGIYTAEMGNPPQEPDDRSAVDRRRLAARQAVKQVAKPQPQPPRAPASTPQGRQRPTGGIFREGMPVPQDIDGSSVRYKSGGKVSASSRADGIAQRGKTRGTMVMCGGGMAKKK